MLKVNIYFQELIYSYLSILISNFRGEYMKEYKRIIWIGIWLILVFSLGCFIYSFIKVNVSNNFGDSATWFGGFITVSALAVAYWQLIYSKKENEPNLLVVESTKKIQINFKVTSFEYNYDNFDFQIANVGKGSATNINTEINNFEQFKRKIEVLTSDFATDENWIYVGLRHGNYHLQTVASYSLSIKNFLSLNMSTNVHIPEFYLYLLKNYFCDIYLKIKKESKDKLELDSKLFEAIKKFPPLDYKISSTNIDNEKQSKYFKITPYAYLLNMQDDFMSEDIFFDFQIENINN